MSKDNKSSLRRYLTSLYVNHKNTRAERLGKGCFGHAGLNRKADQLAKLRKSQLDEKIRAAIAKAQAAQEAK